MFDRRTLLLSSLALSVTGPVLAQGRKPVPVIFHTDIGGDVDDTFALLYLLRRPELDLKLVATDAGSPDYKARLTGKLLTLAKRTDVAIAMGRPKGEETGAQSDWLGDYRLDDYPGVVRRDAAQAMIDTVMTSPEPVTILSVGPATELAEALKREPQLAKKARFIGMFGSVRIGYKGVAPADAEYNVKIDPAALRTIFEADWISCAITPLDTCGLVTLDGPDWRKLWDSRDPFAVACIENSKVWLPNAPWMAKDFDLSKQSSVQFDAVAVEMAFDESRLVMETLPLSVTDEGMTLIDPVKGRPVRVATQWKDLAGFKRELVEALTRAA
ncbi:nucleoside hydrolase [Asticcacaulis sp. AND118]|uniref:nucleoside hydrolase n=1 Tax=Asticcacaulis sp. AND118 TaxID=2840468 RepID=UPI001CFF6D57|nr:nucleoside hydrolase [Asticcacaulis sp. AND118]UDF02720.1 nucleoside hydrolase [Asticcacaulis sp. AND118]